MRFFGSHLPILYNLFFLVSISFNGFYQFLLVSEILSPHIIQTFNLVRTQCSIIDADACPVRDSSPEASAVSNGVVNEAVCYPAKRLVIILKYETGWRGENLLDSQQRLSHPDYKTWSYMFCRQKQYVPKWN